MKKLFAIAEDPALRDVNQMELLVAFIVVFISACLEGYGLHQSIKEANERMERTGVAHMGVFRFGGVPSRRSLRPSLWKTRLL